MKRKAGFTLIELLVGLSLLALMTLALFSALRFGTTSWERVEEKSIQVVDLSIFEGALRRGLGGAFPVRTGLLTETKIGFDGASNRVRFFAMLPAHFTGGGLSLVELSLQEPKEAGRAGRDLVMRHALQNGKEMEFQSESDVRTQRLLSGIDSIELSYFGSESDLIAAKWSDKWEPVARLPQLIKFRINFSSPALVREFVIPLMVGEEAGCQQAAFQRVCGARS